VLARVRAVPAGFAARAPRVRGETTTRDWKGAIELSWTIFENMRDLLGDLLRAKNTGVTNFLLSFTSF
jgi:hypothetical protein